MSKSLGTGIDPLDLIDGGPRPPVYEEGGEFPAYGADALRFGLLAMSSSQDVRFNEERVKQGRDLANKLWNASRLILLRVCEVEPDAGAGADGRGPLDRVAARAPDRARHGAARRLPLLAAALELYGGVLVGARATGTSSSPSRGSTRRTTREVSAVLLWSLERTLRLLHPVMPFVTEEIWSLMPGETRAARGGRLPGGRPGAISSTRTPRPSSGRLIEAVTALRRYRDEVGAKPSASIRGAPRRRGLRRLPRPPGAGSRASSGWTSVGRRRRRWPPCRCPAAGCRCCRPRRSTRRRPSARLESKRADLRREIERAERKLANEEFVAKAPAGGGGGGAPQARRVPRGARAAATHDLRARPRSTCSPSSCSGCGSGSTACTS